MVLCPSLSHWRRHQEHCQVNIVMLQCAVVTCTVAGPRGYKPRPIRTHKLLYVSGTALSMQPGVLHPSAWCIAMHACKSVCMLHAQGGLPSAGDPGVCSCSRRAAAVEAAMLTATAAGYVTVKCLCPCRSTVRHCHESDIFSMMTSTLRALGCEPHPQQSRRQSQLNAGAMQRTRGQS